MAGFFEKHGEALVVAIIAACAFGYYQHFVVPKQIEEAVNASQRNADAVLTNALQQQQGQISILNQKLKDYENGMEMTSRTVLMTVKRTKTGMTVTTKKKITAPADEQGGRR